MEEQLSDSQVDTLLESPQDKPTGVLRDQAVKPQVEAQPTANEIYRLKVNGKDITGNRDQVTQWAQQGYDYAQKMNEYNRLKQEYDQKHQSLSQIESKYKPVEDYISKNPQWWDHVQKSWSEREQLQQQQFADNPAMKEISALKQELQDLRQFKDELTTEKNLTKQKEEDSVLDKEIKSIRDNYKDIDFDRADDSGKSLEYRVLEHAQTTGISSFRAAFRDYYHDQLVALKQEKAKEGVVTDIQKQTKLGLLGKSQTPLKGIKEAKNVKSQSYNDLLQEALSELQGA